jgi:CRISPR-associated protein Cas2
MPYQPVEVSEYQTMWLLVMFDLPVKTKAQRRRYTQFRATLLGEGFSQLQYSVYARPFPTEEASQPCRNLLAGALPAQGYVRLLLVTDRQFGKMRSFFGQKEVAVEEPIRQILLF